MTSFLTYVRSVRSLIVGHVVAHGVFRTVTHWTWPYRIIHQRRQVLERVYDPGQINHSVYTGVYERILL